MWALGFSSGVDHCEWAFLGGLVPDPETGQPDFWTFLVPRKDFKILSIWNTIGLGGTKVLSGRHCRRRLRSAYRTHRSKDGFAATNPGPGQSGLLYAAVRPGLRAGGFVLLHALQGALDTFLETGARRKSNNTFASAAGDPDVQVLVAETQAAIDEMKRVPQLRRAQRLCPQGEFATISKPGCGSVTRSAQISAAAAR